MTFVHEDDEFHSLLLLVAERTKLAPPLVEKDYWVTHTLWSLQHVGLEIWFKGGTTLSKAFGIVERFSEDLDLKIEPGRVEGLPAVSSWKSTGKRATRERQAYFAALERSVDVPGATVRLDHARADASHRSACYEVLYPNRSGVAMPAPMRPFVLLEVGSARVTPFVECDLSSFVHDEVERAGLSAEFHENRPSGVRCVHPLVTLLEKLDALQRRVPTDQDPATFVRHYDDAARIIEAEATLPELGDDADVRTLATELAQQRQIRRIPASDDPAFGLTGRSRSAAIRAAYDAIAPMFWGPRAGIDEACATIRNWIRMHLE